MLKNFGSLQRDFMHYLNASGRDKDPHLVSFARAGADLAEACEQLEKRIAKIEESIKPQAK